MDTNNNPLQPGTGTLPQPTAFSGNVSQPIPAENTNTMQGADSASQQPPDQPTPGPLGAPSAQTSQQLQPAQLNQPTQPAIAQIPDTDDISQQWTHTVDGLRRQFIQDPKLFAQEFEKAKAKYVSGRYGKQLKLPEENK